MEGGLILRALRFFETKGFLEPWRAGSSRLYSKDDRLRLTMIIKGRQLGFALREIVDLITSAGSIGRSNVLGLTRQLCIEQIKLLERQKREFEDPILEQRRTYVSRHEQEPNEDRTLRSARLSEQR